MRETSKRYLIENFPHQLVIRIWFLSWLVLELLKFDYILMRWRRPYRPTKFEWCEETFICHCIKNSCIKLLKHLLPILVPIFLHIIILCVAGETKVFPNRTYIAIQWIFHWIFMVFSLKRLRTSEVQQRKKENFSRGFSFFWPFLFCSSMLLTSAK